MRDEATDAGQVSEVHRVTDADTARALGSGEAPVLGTPRLIAWLEPATVRAAAPFTGWARPPWGPPSGCGICASDPSAAASG
ncbi:hypothetical protein [Streptomyces sp. NPDC091383]|uniref:hypothetical protein n=1 Tax=Streptomyces sp. NPDC091383 TaxID=3365996 RepID=UPI0037F403A0